MDCVCGCGDEDERNGCCSTFYYGDDEEKRTVTFVLMDLTFWLLVPGLLIIQAFKIAARLDEIRTHTPYEIPSTITWYWTFWPLFFLYAYTAIMIVTWIVFIMHISSRDRRIWISYLFCGLAILTLLSFVSTMMLCDNADAITHNYVNKAMRKHDAAKKLADANHAKNITGNSTDPEGLVRFWDDDDFFEPFDDPYATKIVPYSWFQVILPIAVFFFMLLVTGFVNWITQNSRKVNLMTILCANQAGDVEAFNGFWGGSDCDDHAS